MVQGQYPPSRVSIKNKKLRRKKDVHTPLNININRPTAKAVKFQKTSNVKQTPTYWRKSPEEAVLPANTQEDEPMETTASVSGMS